MRRVVTGFLLFLSCLVTAAAEDDPIKKDLAKLQGFWKVTAAIAEGAKAPAEEQAKMAVTFTGEDLSLPNGVVKVKLDPSQKPPAIDLIHNNKKEAALGIYEFDGQTLKLCWSKPGTARPKAFESAKGSGTFYLELQRGK